MPTKQKRYLRKHPEYRNVGRQKNYASTAGPKLNRNHGEEWLVREVNVLENWPYTDRELHKFLGRSVQAIQVMRHKLKKGVKHG